MQGLNIMRAQRIKIKPVPPPAPEKPKEEKPKALKGNPVRLFFCPPTPSSRSLPSYAIIKRLWDPFSYPSILNLPKRPLNRPF